jgi:hypothetical protein
MTRAAAIASPSALDELRTACARVAGQADHVRIVEDRIADYAQFILGKYKVITGHDEHHLVTDDEEQTASYILALGSINFGSGYFKAVGLEYQNVAGGLKSAFLRGEINTAEKWVAVTPGDLRRIFVPSVPGSIAEELMELFSRHLAFTGHALMEQYGGKAMNLVAAAGGSAARLTEIVGAWPTFHDVASYKGGDISFLKRAQLFAAHLELTGIPKFRDMDALTCFADNMVPHVLRCDGVLEYAPDLAQKIDAGQPLEAGSAEETELRALSIHAVELMRAAAPPGTTAPNIDHLLWNRGYEPEIYARPSHRTLTVWY